MSHVNEYETTVSHVTVGHEKDEYVLIETSEKTVISALEAKPDRFEMVFDDNTPGLPRLVRFRIPWNEVSWGALAKRTGNVSAGSLANLRERNSSAVPGEAVA